MKKDKNWISSLASQLGRMGGQQRALNLTPEERREISRRANEARWKGKTKEQRAKETQKARAAARVARKTKGSNMVSELLNIFRFEIA